MQTAALHSKLSLSLSLAPSRILGLLAAEFICVFSSGAISHKFHQPTCPCSKKWIPERERERDWVLSKIKREHRLQWWLIGWTELSTQHDVLSKNQSHCVCGSDSTSCSAPHCNVSFRFVSRAYIFFFCFCNSTDFFWIIQIFFDCVKIILDIRLNRLPPLRY